MVIFSAPWDEDGIITQHSIHSMPGTVCLLFTAVFSFPVYCDYCEPIVLVFGHHPHYHEVD